jgi:hypothetical protein
MASEMVTKRVKKKKKKEKEKERERDMVNDEFKKIT